jgi:hypothetical protein
MFIDEVASEPKSLLWLDANDESCYASGALERRRRHPLHRQVDQAARGAVRRLADLARLDARGSLDALQRFADRPVFLHRGCL